MTEHPSIRNIIPRDFTSEEATVLEKMLSADFEGKGALREQLSHTKVTGYCDCGCKSVRFACNPSASKYPFNERIPVEMEVMDEDGVPVLFLLHMISGYVSELEVFRADSEPIAELPDVCNAVVTSH